MNLKVGDKVRIKEDLKVGIYENYVSVQEEMLKYAGNIATLTKEPYPGVFKIDIDDSDGERWSWYSFMFEEIIANKAPKLEDGMAVHCDTLDKSKIFLDECEKQGIRTCAGLSASGYNVWNRLGESTCYSISKRNNRKSLIVMHDSKDYYANNSKYKLYEFDELFKEGTIEKTESSVKSFRKRFHEDINQFNEGASVEIKNEIKKLKPQGIMFTKDKKGNPTAILPKYEVLYEKQYYKGEKDVKKVIMNGKCLIVILENGAKGIAKCSPGDTFDKDIGFKIALKRARQNSCNVCKAPF